jgi:hypothetical protein
VLKKSTILKFMSFWPPFFGAGIRVKHISKDFRSITVEMKKRWWNSNYVGTHFGGSLYAMTDPFYMLMLLENLGREYIVWDKSARIQFKNPGRGTVRAHFTLTEERLVEIRRLALEQDKVEPIFLVEVLGEQGEVIAIVEKLLYVRRKDKVRARPSQS